MLYQYLLINNMSDIDLDAAKAAIYKKFPSLEIDQLTQIVSADENKFDQNRTVNISENGMVRAKNVARFDMFVYIDKAGKNINTDGFDSYLYNAAGFVKIVKDNYVFLLQKGVYVGGSRSYKKI
jgi:hypothetical protein